MVSEADRWMQTYHALAQLYPSLLLQPFRDGSMVPNKIERLSLLQGEERSNMPSVELRKTLYQWFFLSRMASLSPN